MVSQTKTTLFEHKCNNHKKIEIIETKLTIVEEQKYYRCLKLVPK